MSSPRARHDAHEWSRPLARPGLGARAVIYVVATTLACLIVANGKPPAQESSVGAVALVIRQPGGPEIGGLLALCLLCYALWRLTQCVFGIEPASHDDPGLLRRLGWLLIAIAYLVLFAETLRLLAGSGSSGGASSHPQRYVAEALSWPGGTFIVGFLGSALVIAGLALAAWGVTHDYRSTLEEDQMRTTLSWTARLAGMAGNVVRGGLVGLVGAYLLMAAVADTPTKAKSLDQALEQVARQPSGPWWIGVAALGLACYAVFSALEARFRRV